jgi:hypothetical protein
MPEHACHHAPDGEAVPEAIGHEEKTVEVPGVPREPLPDQETVPVRSSLEKMLRHEVLQQRSARDDDSEER